MKIVCTSDTHGMHEQLDVPDGDMFIHAGDISESSRTEDFIRFNQFLADLPHPYKIVLSGNHDIFYELRHHNLEKLLSNAIYLKHGKIIIENLIIWGSSWQPNLFGFHWSDIPPAIDLLITHIPPYGILDRTAQGKRLGSKELLQRVREINPKFHVFGHIHEAYGIEKQAGSKDGTVFVNCSAIRDFGGKLNSVILIEL